MLIEGKTGRLRGKKELRTGFTTGACAAAASKAAAIALLSGKPVDAVDLTLPAGQKVLFKVHSCQLKGSSVTCSVIKDAGDDPDVTHGAEIRATVSWDEKMVVELEGGEGVGRVTMPGLGLEIGSPAINQVPRRMIIGSVSEVVSQTAEKRGVRVVISVPDGQKIAKNTLNQRLGIIGGISILGTSGLVIPYSTTAFKACIAKAIKVAIASGNRHLALTTGGRSEAFARRHLVLPEVACIQMGDWVGFTLKASARIGASRVTVCGMVGKLSKIASGRLQTHVSRSKTDMAFLASVASRVGISPDIVDKIVNANTVRYVSEIIPENMAPKFFNEICRRVSEQGQKAVNGAIPVECLMTDFDGKRLLGRAVTDG